MLLRPATADDLPFVLDSWRLSATAAAKAWPAHATPFSLDHARAVISDPRTVAYVAAHAEHDDVIVGWVLARLAWVEYVYVKRDARRLGIATELLELVQGVPMPATLTAPWIRDWFERKWTRLTCASSSSDS